jgi:hypothetical protein
LEHTDLTGNNAISKEKHKIQDFFLQYKGGLRFALVVSLVWLRGANRWPDEIRKLISKY